MTRQQILKNAAALPGKADDENRYPLLGGIVISGMRDVRITKDELVRLFKESGLSLEYLPSAVRAPDAFRRATQDIQTTVPKPLPDGTFEFLMVRDVVSDKDEIVRHLVREVRNSSKKVLSYKHIGTMIFRRDMSDYITHSILPEADSLLAKSSSVYKEYMAYYTGKAMRDLVHKVIKSTTPVALKNFGALYFVSREHLPLMESLETFVKKINEFKVNAAMYEYDTTFEVIPMLDLEKQRCMIFEKYESQVNGSVEGTLTEMAEILNGGKTPSKGVKAKYIDTVNELRVGIEKYEKLLERDMTLAKTKVDLLEQQILAIVLKEEAIPQPSATASASA